MRPDFVHQQPFLDATPEEFVGDGPLELKREEESAPAHVRDERMILPQGSKTAEEVITEFAGTAREIVVDDVSKDRRGDGADERAPAERRAVVPGPEDAELLLGAHDTDRDPARDALSQGDDVGLETGVAARGGAGPVQTMWRGAKLIDVSDRLYADSPSLVTRPLPSLKR